MLRQLPPAAAPISVADVWHGVVGMASADRTRADLERDLAAAMGVDTVVLTSSGRAALVVVLNALKEVAPSRRAVIIPAYACYSVPAAIVRAHLQIKLCDIDPESLDFDYRHLAALAGEPDTLCVIATHLFGVRADVRRAHELARPHGVFVIDDAAQAFGSSTADGPAGTLGDVGIFSFGRGKAVTAVDGGAIVCGSPGLADRIRHTVRQLPEPGFVHNLVTLAQSLVLLMLLRPSLYWLPASLPFLRLGQTIFSTQFPIEKMAGAAAGLLRRWQARLAAANDARWRRAALISGQVPGLRRTAAACLRLPIICASEQERDRLISAGTRAGLGFSVMYPSALNAVPQLRDRLTPRAFPNAERLARCLLTVPVHPFVSANDVRLIAGVLQSAMLMESPR